jgi:hypothetical protein
VATARRLPGDPIPAAVLQAPAHAAANWFSLTGSMSESSFQLVRRIFLLKTAVQSESFSDRIRGNLTSRVLPAEFKSKKSFAP